MCPKTNQPEQDVVYTPEFLAKDIWNHFSSQFKEEKFLEPCRGDGVFYNLMPEGSDYCEIQEGIDFLKYQGKPTWIVTNPPWSKIRQFLDKSFELNVNNIVYLCNFNAFTTKARLRSIYNNGYGIKEVYCVTSPGADYGWPVMGFQLGAIHIQKNYTGGIMMTGGIGK